MRIVWRLSLTLIVAGLVWLSWQSPLSAPTPPMVQSSLPVDAPIQENREKSTAIHESVASPQKSTPMPDEQLWRVITRRVISRDGIRALENRLKGMGFTAIKFQHQEAMTMHAFDDITLFKTRKKAYAAAAFWQGHGIETTVIKAADKGVYLVGLGRFFQVKYAEGMQKRLDRIDRKYRYQQRTVPIPAWRFTFTAMDKATADKLWRKLEISGVVMPILMPEARFQELYGGMVRSEG